MGNNDLLIVAVFILGLALIGVVGYYLIVVTPQQAILQNQLEIQAREAQILAAISFCNNIGQQYNFGEQRCEGIPIEVSVGRWVDQNVSPVLDDLFRLVDLNNPDNLVSKVSVVITDVFNFWNPSSPTSIWNQGLVFLFGSG